jgi:hypothetical protein
MKTVCRIIAAAVAGLSCFNASAQCDGQLQTIIYDTFVTSTGNGLSTFTFPKFDPQVGTLTEVTFTSDITLSYRFQLENNEPFAISNYRVRIVREQEISSNALLTPLTSTYQQTYGNFALAASNGVPGSGPDFIEQGPHKVMDRTIINQTVYNTADFLGMGDITLDFYALTYSIVFGSVNYNYNGTAEDTLRFSITYTYCPVKVLNADITRFNVRKADEHFINIEWITQNEISDRTYEVEKSTDGRQFDRVAQFPAKTGAATGTYHYQYTLQPTDTRKLVFRIKQIQKDGGVKYSPLRIVEGTVPSSGNLRVYPNPAAGSATILFSDTKRGNWDVDVFGVTGQHVKRYHYSNTLLAKINASGELKRGIYTIVAVNRDTKEKLMSRLIVQ